MAIKYFPFLTFFLLASSVPHNFERKEDDSTLAKYEDHHHTLNKLVTHTSPSVDGFSTFNNPGQLEYYNELMKSNNQQLKARALEPEATMSIDEIIQYHGYPIVSYEVTTEDGYILTIQRIPHGLAGPGGQPKKPVLVQHGLLCSSASWVTNSRDKNLPYILADAGYDVWLGNVRGTIYGRKHLTLSPENTKFWAYSFDEMAKYDVPAVIDTILNVTGYNNIHYIGHSMGSLIAFAMLATQPKYNDIIKGMMGLAPVAYLGNVRSPIKYFQHFSGQLDYLFQLLGKGEFLPNNALIKTMASSLCVSPFRILCSSVIFVMCGFNIDQLNMTRLPVILHHTPAATSTQNVIHFVQMINTGKFQYQDFGPTENKKRYGQLVVPLYNISRITAPVAVFWGENDLLATPSDVAKLAQNLPNLVYKYRVPMSKFSHTDFIWAIDGKTLLYDRVISIMGTLWK